MELLPKKATEKIGEAIRKKLPKKSVAFSGSENGLFKKGIGQATDRMAVRGDSDPARLSRTTASMLPIRQIAVYVCQQVGNMADSLWIGSTKICNFLAVRRLGG